LGLKKVLGTKPTGVPGESPARTDLDLWMPMACQVVSALVHKREREKVANIGSGKEII
jgi:hypothetical protein